jgi:hypothetical protein
MYTPCRNQGKTHWLNELKVGIWVHWEERGGAGTRRMCAPASAVLSAYNDFGMTQLRVRGTVGENLKNHRVIDHTKYYYALFTARVCAVCALRLALDECFSSGI